VKDRIRKIRRDLDLTQQEFADRIGIKRGAIANYEIGRNAPTDSVVSLICREFGVSEEWLRKGTGEMFAPDAGGELEALVKKYDLSNADQVLIEKYVNLKAGSRETIINFITDVVASLEDLEPNAKALSSDSASELDIDAEVEAYRQQLELQKKAEPILNAAHDMGATEEEKQRADDIMMNDDEWK
jgi:hypothetical protein